MPLIQQPSRLYLQRFGKFLHHRHRRIALPAFDIANIGAVDAGAVGIVLLAPAPLLAETANVSAKASADIHDAY